MRARPTRTIAALAVGAAVSRLTAAPMPPIGPADITGTIAALCWVDRHEEKARIPGASGTLGVDRVIGAHYLVILHDVAGPDGKTLEALAAALCVTVPGYLAPPGQRGLSLQLNSDDPGLLRAGMRIRVIGYELGGDEGAVWTRYDKLEILDAPAERD
jgi:hypothetical protein